MTVVPNHVHLTQRPYRYLPSDKLMVTLTNVPFDENVCCVVEVADVSTPAILAWYLSILLDVIPLYAPKIYMSQVLFAYFRKEYAAAPHAERLSTTHITVC
jgi:hypothetical protein